MKLTIKQIESYLYRLELDERSPATLEKYRRDLLRFFRFLPTDQPLNKSMVNSWKKELIARQYSIATINSMLAPVNGLLSYLHLHDLRVRPLKRQRPAFSDGNRELSKEEYTRLVQAARTQGHGVIALILETLCATGMRVSELSFVTVEAVQNGCADLFLKGKWRRILFPQALIQKLLRYIRSRGIKKGLLFRRHNGLPINRYQVWRAMKGLCAKAGVAAPKAFPHNLRHLFARTFYTLTHDLAKLADVLGHSSIETTRLYIITTGKEHQSQLNRMHLVT